MWESGGSQAEVRGRNGEYMIIAVDFDGTLCRSVWPGIGAPNIVLINYIKARQKRGDKFILWTCREGKKLEEAVEWCKAHGLKFDAVNDNLSEKKKQFGNDPRKIFANEYWDDKARGIFDVMKMAYRGQNGGKDK